MKRTLYFYLSGILILLGGTKMEAEEIVLGGGCFWCLEAVYEEIPGVLEVESGYAGGAVVNPNYDQVSSGRTGHAEVVRVKYDPAIITEEKILEWFWKMHDPTTINRQGADVGSQYRSIIFYKDADQRTRILTSMQLAQQTLPNPIITQVVLATTFYPAEDYHQDYFKNNPDAGYCRVVIAPKLDKLRLR